VGQALREPPSRSRVEVIVQSGEDQEQAQARYFVEHPEDVGKNVILRVMV